MSKSDRRGASLYAFDLENAIATWRQFLSRDASLTPEDLEELEDHLREEIGALKTADISDEERFRAAVRRVGDMADVSADYRRVLLEKRLDPHRAQTNGATLGLLGSYFKTAWIGIVRHKGFAFLNLSGLALALGACIILVLYVLREFSYDGFNEKADRIYRIETTLPGEEEMTPRMPSTLQPFGPVLKTAIPEVEHVARLSSYADVIVHVDEHPFAENRFLFSEPSLFDIFDFDVTSGSADGLSAPHAIMLSESAAEKYFSEGDAVGQDILVGEHAAETPETYEVVGVYADMPSNSHFRADFIASFETVQARTRDAEWQHLAFTYLSVQPDAQRTAIQAKMQAVWREHAPEDMGGSMLPVLQPLKRIHLFSEVTTYDLEPQGDITYVYLFILAAVLLLLVACLNYVNLAVARFSARAREVGVRKVVGAGRSHLIRQFLGESVLYCVASLVLAAGLASLALPVLNQEFELNLSLSSHLPTLLEGFVPSILAIAVLAGGYPALFLSRFSPGLALRGDTGPGGQARFRKSLILFQFVITSGLVVGTMVVWSQLRFAQDTKMGFEGEQIVILPTNGALEKGAPAFRDALNSLAGVQSVSLDYTLPGHPGAIRSYRTGEIEAYVSETEFVRFDVNWVDTTFINTLGLSLASGRFFAADRPRDLAQGIVVNEAAVRRMGWTEPLGKHLGTGDSRKEIIGVLHDFHSASMYETIQPLVLEYGEFTRMAAVRASTSDLRRLVADLGSIWGTFIPDRPFEYSFLDDDFKAMYRKETQMGRLFTTFSLLTIIVALLGLFGLASFDAQQRTKEIGIRKSLGASVSSITVLLSRQFFMLVLVSFVISIPIIYWIMSRWLERFAYRIDLTVGLFALSCLLVLFVTTVTIAVQTVRAAVTSPVECLRQE